MIIHNFILPYVQICFVVVLKNNIYMMNTIYVKTFLPCFFAEHLFHNLIGRQSSVANDVDFKKPQVMMLAK